MIWLFKIDEVFWGNPEKVSEHYIFDTNDIEFDIRQYDICLYMATSDYYLLSEDNDQEIYSLRYNGLNINPIRLKLRNTSETYQTIRDFYIKTQRDQKINQMLK